MFLLFAGDHYYPCGGWEDFRGAYGSLELAKEAAHTQACDWWHIVDVSAGWIVTRG